MAEITLEDEIEAVRQQVEWWQENAKRCAARAAEGTMSYEAAIEAAKTASLWASVLSRLEASRWRPIAEAPKDGSYVLIGWFEFPGQDDMKIAFWHSTHRAWCGAYTLFSKDKNWQPTHWRPMPSPPSTTSEGSEGAC